MNSFARGLFQLLIGWCRSLTALWDGDWTRLDSLFDWVTRHWLLLTVVLILIGTAADFFIWLVRWRPDKAWRSKWQALRSFSLNGYLQDLRFDRGYANDNTQIMEAARPVTAEQPCPPLAETARWDSAGEALKDFRPGYSSLDVMEERAQLEADLGVPAYAPPEEEPAPQETSAPGPRRRRTRPPRSSRIREAMDLVRRRREEEDEYEPNVLPPIMSKEEAFRAPVYPRGRSAAAPIAQEEHRRDSE